MFLKPKVQQLLTKRLNLWHFFMNYSERMDDLSYIIRIFVTAY